MRGKRPRVTPSSLSLGSCAKKRHASHGLSVRPSTRLRVSDVWEQLKISGHCERVYYAQAASVELVGSAWPAVRPEGRSGNVPMAWSIGI